jgi:mRNA-degrading endonuclease RelE of RelBE toxin-antitoxin system
MWKVTIKKKVEKKLKKLPPDIGQRLFALVQDLETDGPVQSKWQNYSKLGGDRHHCHLTYRYVACWIEEEGELKIEVYYAGSRENAPY